MAQINLNSDPDPYQGGYPVIELTHTDIPAFIDLQWKVWHTLGAHEKHHLKIREAEDLAKHLDAGMVLLGVKTPYGELVAQGLVTDPMNPAAKNLEGYPFWGMEAQTIVIQSVVSVQKGAAQAIYAKAKEMADESGKTLLLAKVADSNDKSQTSFLNGAFTKAAKGFDHAKGYPVTFFVHHRTASCQGVALEAKVA